MINSTINAASTEMFSMTVPVTFIYNTPRVEVGQNCEELVFSVSAVNNIGWSSLAVVTGGFPMGNMHTLHNTAVCVFPDCLKQLL